MNELNPELNTQVQALATLVGRKLSRDGVDLDNAAKPLLDALVRGGYARISDLNLQARLEAAVVERFPKKAIHRRGELRGLTGNLQRTFSSMVTWETNTPKVDSPPKSANISSATDA